MPPPWTSEEIQDPWRSAEIAYNDFYISRGYEPWSTRNTLARLRAPGLSRRQDSETSIRVDVGAPQVRPHRPAR